MKNGREGNFSSSQVWKLMKNGKAKGSFGAPFYTYIAEKKMERRLGRAINSETTAKSTSWGNFIEGIAFNKLGLEYKLESKVRYKHDDYPLTGAPDLITENVVGDIKCPWTMKSFCELVDSFESLEAFKKHAEPYYWQLVSNSILTGLNKAEIIAYVPYKEDLDEIREAANNFDGDQNKVAFINWATDDELPYLIKGKYYKDVNIFQFTVPEEDKHNLIERVKAATELLNS